MWRPEVSIKCLPQLLTILVFKAESLTEELDWLARQPEGSSCGLPLQTHTAAPSFHVDAGALLVLHARAAGGAMSPALLPLISK